jgi:hypothetical protein
MQRINPFRPGSLVTPGMFAGRSRELTALDQALVQANAGNPEHFMITGERGIGKSSLFFLLDRMASGHIESAKTKFSFVVVNISLQSSMTHCDLLRSLGGGLQRSIAERFPLEDKAKIFWDFLTRWEAFGVSFAQREEEESRPFELLGQLIQDVGRASEKVREKKGHGILFLIDEADKPSPSSHLGLTLKLLSEGLDKRGSHHVSIFLAGLPGLSGQLRESHESSVRIFKPLILHVLDKEDRAWVVKRGLEQANTQNESKTTIQPKALEILCDLSEGFPHFIQQYAYSAFAVDDDFAISTNDVETGAFGAGGALEELGRKYFEELYFDRINSDDYRRVLHAMADYEDDWVSKKSIRERSKIKEGVLANALNVLRERRLIIAKPGVKGAYKLPSASFAKWIKQCAKKH